MVKAFEPHKKVTVHVEVRKWDRFNRRAVYVQQPRTFKLPYCSFKETNKPGFSGNNISKIKLLIFLSLVQSSGNSRGFTNTEICKRISLKKSYLEGRGGILTKWGNVTRKLRPNGIFEYRLGENSDTLLRHCPEGLFNRFANEAVSNNPDLFGYSAFTAKKSNIVNTFSKTINVERKTLERYRMLTWNGRSDFYGSDIPEEEP